MSAIEAIENLVDHLVWPITVGAFGIGFRKSLSELINRISKVRVPGLEVDAVPPGEIRELAESAGGSVAQSAPLGAAGIAASIGTPGYEVDQYLLSLKSLAPISPGPATIAAHDLLAAQLQRLAMERHGMKWTMVSPHSMVKMLSASGDLEEPSPLVGKPLADVLPEATEVARKVQDGATIGVKEALSYIDTIDVLIARINAATVPFHSAS